MFIFKYRHQIPGYIKINNQFVENMTTSNIWEKSINNKKL